MRSLFHVSSNDAFRLRQPDTEFLYRGRLGWMEQTTEANSKVEAGNEWGEQ